MTPEEQKTYIQNLERDIIILESLKKEIESKQISFPLDRDSQTVIHEDLMVPTGNVLVPYSLATYDDFVQFDLNGKRYYALTTSKLP